MKIDGFLFVRMIIGNADFIDDFFEITLSYNDINYYLRVYEKQSFNNQT